MNIVNDKPEYNRVLTAADSPRRSLSPNKVHDYQLAYDPAERLGYKKKDKKLVKRARKDVSKMQPHDLRAYLARRPLNLTKFQRTLAKSLRRSEGLSMIRIAQELEIPLDVLIAEMPHLLLEGDD